jgi:LysR family transcriptional regulator, hydrogen peroxide-inducible genes activator
LPLLATHQRSELDGLMRVREVADEEVERQIGLAWRRTDTRAPAFQELAEFLRTVAPAGTRPFGLSPGVSPPERRWPLPA